MGAPVVSVASVVTLGIDGSVVTSEICGSVVSALKTQLGVVGSPVASVVSVASVAAIGSQSSE